MTPRERVTKTINFEEPDRVPIDLGGMRATGINAVVYDRLKQQLGIRTKTRLRDPLQILAEVELPVLEAIGGDVVGLELLDGLHARRPESDWGPRRLFCGLEVLFPPDTAISEDPDGSWIYHGKDGARLARMPKDGYYFDFLTPTMADHKIDPDLFRPSSVVPDEQLRALEEHTKHLYEETDYAILGWGASISFVGLSSLLADNITQGALSEWMIMLMTEKETCHEMMGRAVDASIAQLSLIRQAVDDRCVAWGISSDDAGTQRQEFLQPDLWDEMILPHYARLCDWVHRNTSWKTFMHSCGSIYRYIPGLIDAGIDILNPVQISAANMEPERLKAEFGGKIVFWGGGVDTQVVLPLSTPEEVRESVRHNAAVFAPGGGYVFSQVHNIQQNVPVENVAAMLEAAGEYVY